VATQRAHLRVAQVGVGAFGVAAVTKAHEFDFWINPGGGFYLRHLPKEVPLSPGQPDAFESVRVVAGDDQRSVTIADVETMHDVGPQRGPVVIVQRQIHHLTRLVVNDSRYVRSIGRAKVRPGQPTDDVDLSLQPKERDHRGRADRLLARSICRCNELLQVIVLEKPRRLRL
jgi:hypothetical protein